MNALKKSVFYLVDLSHSAASDEANYEETLGDDLTWLEASCWNKLECIRIPVAVADIYCGAFGIGLVCKKMRPLKEASSLLVCA
ncbi:hypothetical protein [Granulicella sp. L60]|uniref:hypothetical protein n=1 Tax=Granulicella sp. L60 TaxID=1641866 RepID=UPI0020B141C9|nr:hypothetical protein [Granulicella sp. L60]